MNTWVSVSDVIISLLSLLVLIKFNRKSIPYINQSEWSLIEKLVISGQFLKRESNDASEKLLFRLEYQT